MASSDAQLKSIPRHWLRAAMLLATILFVVGAIRARAADSFSEYKVKALFLYNFAKYVDWPASVFPSTNSPIVIGIIGADRFEGELDATVKGRTLNGRPLLVRRLAAEDSGTNCQILFISNSEAARTAQILARAATAPVLTVGEDEAFLQAGGMINLRLKEGRVRLGVNLISANRTGLKISAKLLAVADEVKH